MVIGLRERRWGGEEGGRRVGGVKGRDRKVEGV